MPPKSKKSATPTKKVAAATTEKKKDQLKTVLGNKEFWDSQQGPSHPNFQQHCNIKRPAEGTNNMTFFSDKEIRGDDNGDGLRDHPLFDGPGEVTAAARSCGKEDDYLAVYKRQSDFFYANKWSPLTGLHCRLVKFKVQAGERTATNTMMEGMTIMDKSHIQFGTFEYRERILHQHVRYPIIGYFSRGVRMARPKDGVVVVCRWYGSDWEDRAAAAARKNEEESPKTKKKTATKAGKRDRDSADSDDEAEEDEENPEFLPKVGDQFTYDVKGLGDAANTTMGHFVVTAQVMGDSFDA